MEVSPIALLTDFGHKDPYVGVMKGVIAKISPDTPVIDVTHEIRPQNVVQASFILTRTYHYFPTGTIFTIVVDPGVGGSRKAIAVRTRNYYFVAPDNGLLAPVLEKKEVLEMVEIANPRYILQPVSNTFHGRDIFAACAAHISHGIPLHEVGPPLYHYTGLDFPPIHVGRYMIRGHVAYTDHFGNLITDIDASLLDSRVVSSIHFGQYELRGINKFYAESQPGELLAIIGSFDTLEIAVNQGSAASIVKNTEKLDVEVWFDGGEVPSQTLL